MMNTQNIKRIENILTENSREKLLNWILNNSLLEDDEYEKKAFAIAWCDKTLPAKLSFFKTPEYNVYNCVFFTTTNNGYIEEHIDTDFVKFLKTTSRYSHIIAGYPSTSVYYVQIDDNMVGGELVVGDEMVKPRQNSCLEIGRGVRHSVNKILKTNLARVAIACERYKIMSSHMNQIDFPIARPG